jgi:hypothetical protein
MKKIYTNETLQEHSKYNFCVRRLVSVHNHNSMCHMTLTVPITK